MPKRFINNIAVPSPMGDQIIDEKSAFERCERERFFDAEYTIERLCEIFAGFNRDHYAPIRSATLKGLEDGVLEYLKNHPSANIYESDLIDFSYDDSTQWTVLDSIAGLGLPQEVEFARDVCQNYRFFIVNDSNPEYQKRFSSN